MSGLSYGAYFLAKVRLSATNICAEANSNSSATLYR